MLRIFFATLAALLVAGKLGGIFDDVSWWVILSPVYVYYILIVAAILTGLGSTPTVRVVKLKDLEGEIQKDIQK